MSKKKQGYLPGAEHMAPPSFRDIDATERVHVRKKKQPKESE